MAGKSEKRKYTTITIPTRLFEKLQDKIRRTGFSSVSDYVTYILRETVSEMELRKTKKGNTANVVEKLKALGYLE
jgi:metal-responsive CopG/Arc/MetJ family transcriptional regulator